jgi:hypothetical protein
MRKPPLVGFGVQGPNGPAYIDVHRTAPMLLAVYMMVKAEQHLSPET